ncbi:MAG: thioesterase family protein [Bacteroidales bacterium]|nr:thioesterase family protein [Bacteroidales bacterium]
MNFNIPEGLENQRETVVKESNTAIASGSGLLPVFATPAMIALMEETAHQSIAKHLPSGFTSVGTKVSINHIKATPLGIKVICHSKLVKVDGRRLCFEVKACDEAGLIGNGTHERFIVEAERFMNKIQIK